jgi:transcriptional regulator with XRE-family HTH domain
MARSRRSAPYYELQHILVLRRTAANISQAELGERLGRPQSFVSKYESGERRLDVVELIEVAMAIGCRADEIVATLSDSILKMIGTSPIVRN